MRLKRRHARPQVLDSDEEEEEEGDGGRKDESGSVTSKRSSDRTEAAVPRDTRETKADLSLSVLSSTCSVVQSQGRRDPDEGQLDGRAKTEMEESTQGHDPVVPDTGDGLQGSAGGESSSH